MTLSDKLFYWVFQNNPDRILELQPDLAQAPDGYRFSAPALKERERRLDGLFRPLQESAQQPVVILEAQMAADTGFLRRLYLESAMLLDQEPGIDHWRVVVICPQRRLNFGRELAEAEFLRERVHWIELESAAADPAAPPRCCGPWRCWWSRRSKCRNAVPPSAGSQRAPPRPQRWRM